MFLIARAEEAEDSPVQPKSPIAMALGAPLRWPASLIGLRGRDDMSDTPPGEHKIRMSPILRSVLVGDTPNLLLGHGWQRVRLTRARALWHQQADIAYGQRHTEM